MVCVCFIYLNLAQDDVLYLSLELKILKIEFNCGLYYFCWLLLSVAFSKSSHPPRKLPPCLFIQERVNNSGQVAKEIESDSPELDLRQKGFLLFSTS